MLYPSFSHAPTQPDSAFLSLRSGAKKKMEFFLWRVRCELVLRMRNGDEAGKTVRLQKSPRSVDGPGVVACIER